MTDRDYVLMALAQKTVVDGLERLGQHISPRVLAGAIKDAGRLDGYATPRDYPMALGDFVSRRRRARFHLPGPYAG